MWEVWKGKVGQSNADRQLLGKFEELDDAKKLAEEHGMENCSIEMGLGELNKYFVRN